MNFGIDNHNKVCNTSTTNFDYICIFVQMAVTIATHVLGSRRSLNLMQNNAKIIQWDTEICNIYIYLIIYTYVQNVFPKIGFDNLDLLFL